MNELIKITNNSAGQEVVSARDLYKFLEATERFSNWMERNLDYGFVEGVDYLGCKVLNTLAKQNLDDYALTLSTAKEISMIQRSEKGKQARNYFIECEKKLIAIQKYQLLQTKIHKQIKAENKKHLKNIEEPTDKILLNFMKNERELAMIYKIELLQKDLKKLTDACASNGIYL